MSERWHTLKTLPDFFQAVLSGTKTFEVRKDDRGFQAGDVVSLQEWQIPDKRELGYVGVPRYTGRSATYRIGFVFRQGFGVDLGEYVVFSLLPWSTEELE
jgi:hypothetical protein